MLQVGQQSPHLGGHRFLRPVSVQRDFQTFNTTTSPPTRILHECLTHKSKSEQLPRAFLLEPRGSIEHSTQTTRTQRRGPLPVGLTSMDSMGLDSQGVFSLPSGFYFWLQPVKFCFPITGWLLHLKTESSANLLGHIIFRVLVTALYLTPRLLGQWSIDCCSWYPKARLRRIYQLWGRSFCVMHTASSYTYYWDSRQWGSWDFSPGARIPGRTGDLGDRGSGCSVCKQEASWERGSSCLPLLPLSTPKPPSNTQSPCCPLPRGTGCVGGDRCAWLGSSALNTWYEGLPAAVFATSLCEAEPCLKHLTSQFGSVQSLSHVRLFATPWTAARQASLSITNLVSLGLWNGASQPVGLT